MGSICLLSEIDGRYRRLFGYLQDDVSRTRPTADLIYQILKPLESRVGLTRSIFDAHSPLRRYHLVQLGQTLSQSHETLAMQMVQELQATFTSPFTASKTSEVEQI